MVREEGKGREEVTDEKKSEEEFEEVWKEHGDNVLNYNHPWVKSFAK